MVTVSPLCPPLFSWIHASMLLSVAGLVLGAPEACSQSPSSQPSRGLLPCTAPQPPPQPPPQAPGLPPAQQQPAMSSPMMSQVSPTGRTGRGKGRARGILGCSGLTLGFGGPHTHCPTGLCCLGDSVGYPTLPALLGQQPSWKRVHLDKWQTGTSSPQDHPKRVLVLSSPGWVF